MPIRALVAAALAPALGAVLSLFALTLPPPLMPHAPPPAAAPRPVAIISVASFEHRWNALAELPPALPPTKGDAPAPPQTTADVPARLTAPTPPSTPRAQTPLRMLRPQNVCARYGGHRQDYGRENHRYWRCVYPRRAPPRR